MLPRLERCQEVEAAVTGVVAARRRLCGTGLSPGRAPVPSVGMWTGLPSEAMADDPAWLTEQVKALFEDPRWPHLAGLTDMDEWSPDIEGNTDPSMFLQAVLAMHQIRSAEQQGRTIGRATWALVVATAGLVVATIVLVIVTVRSG